MANAIKRNLRRRPIATQFAAPESRTAPKGVPLITQQDVEASLMGSLNALGTDYIDYFLLHETPPDAVRDDALEFLLQAKLLGRIGKTGIAANGGFLQNYSESDLSDWDVVQYEYGPHWPLHDDWLSKFPSKMHIFHSCLSGRQFSSDDEQDAAQILAANTIRNPSGKVLFSSMNIENVRRNTQSVNRSQGV